MFEELNEDNFILFAAKYYNNPQCYDTEEFYDDIKRFKYLKRLFGKYEDSGELKERLILNHIVVLYNIFGNSTTKMLLYKLNGYHQYLKPFLVLLNRMPDTIVSNGKPIYSSDIPMDQFIVNILRKI